MPRSTFALLALLTTACTYSTQPPTPTSAPVVDTADADAAAQLTDTADPDAAVSEHR